jgi:hypothetical protein
MVVRRRKLIAQVPAIRTATAATKSAAAGAASGSQTAVDRATESARAVVNDLVQRPIAKAAVKVQLEWGLNRVPHGMGEAPFSWHATLDAIGAVLYDAQADNPTPERELWVFLDVVAEANAVIWLY